MNLRQLTEHWSVNQYGDFQLTEAIRPSLEVKIAPREGFRFHPNYCSPCGVAVPALIAAVSGERLFEVFLDLLDPLGEVVNVVLETSHETAGPEHRDLFRGHIDLPVLKSHLCDFEDLLLHDGCAGVAVIADERAMEVQFDEHKVLTVFAFEFQPFVDILLAHGVYRDDQLRLISESAHLHGSEPRHAEAFERLCCYLGVSQTVGNVPW